jgi:hypothetical protein
MGTIVSKKAVADCSSRRPNEVRISEDERNFLPVGHAKLAMPLRAHASPVRVQELRDDLRSQGPVEARVVDHKNGMDGDR